MSFPSSTWRRKVVEFTAEKNRILWRFIKSQLWGQLWEDSLEKRIASRSRILAWRIPWIEKLGGLQSMGVHKELNIAE